MQAAVAMAADGREKVGLPKGVHTSTAATNFLRPAVLPQGLANAAEDAGASRRSQCSASRRAATTRGGRS